MAPTATNSGVFNAVAEPRRRALLDLLTDGEQPVNDLVRRLGVTQPQVSKHLRVLRDVGAVTVRDQGRQRLYRLNGPALKPIHDWVKDYESTWTERFEALDDLLEELKGERDGIRSEQQSRGHAAQRPADPDHPGVHRPPAADLQGLDNA